MFKSTKLQFKSTKLSSQYQCYHQSTYLNQPNNNNNMGAAINNTNTSLNQLILSKYKYSEHITRTYQHHFSIWYIETNNYPNIEFNILNIHQQFQLYSDQCYILLHIWRPQSGQINYIPSQYIDFISSIEALQQVYFINEEYQCQQEVFKVDYHVWCGNIVSVEHKATCISIVSGLQEHLRRGSGHPVRNIFNNGLDILSNGSDKIQQRKQSQSPTELRIDLGLFPFIWKFNLFATILIPHLIPHPKKLSEYLLNHHIQQLYQMLTYSPNQEEQRPFLCQITQINTNHKAQQFVMEQSFIPHFESSTQQLILIDHCLYYSTYQWAKSYNTLRQQNITLIINLCGSHCRNWYISDINYKWYFIRQHDDIECILYQTYQAILTNVGNTLLHCHQLPYRSSAILVGIQMIKSKITYQKAYDHVKLQINQFQIRKNHSQQLIQLEKRLLGKMTNKMFKIYAICSYCKQSPSHLVAKYIATVEEDYHTYQKTILIKVGTATITLIIGNLCQYEEKYIQFAYKYINYLQIYQNAPSCKVTIERNKKNTIIPTNNQLLILNPNDSHVGVGYLGCQSMTFKYPILRPIWQQRKQDAYYFIIKEKYDGAHVNIIKGNKWIGYQTDKDDFFDRIVKVYLTHIPFEKIWIQQNAEDSLFQDSYDQ